MSLNKVFLMGNLTRDSELRYIQSNSSAVLEFRMAVSRKYRTASGEDREDVLFIDVTLWGQRRAEALHKYLKRGTKLVVEGRLKLDEWERDGKKNSKISVVADNIEFAGGRGESSGGGGGGGYQESTSGGGGYGDRGYGNRGGGGGNSGGYGGGGGNYSQPQPAGAPAGSSSMELADEDIPF
jgi:single-strand DNA-binding protein